MEVLNCLLHALQEENKILDKLHRQKVAEVEKLSQTVRELEEAVLAGGAAANVVRDYQRKVQEMNVTNYPWLVAFLIKYELSQCLFVP
jgi:hypothetical protein